MSTIVNRDVGALKIEQTFLEYSINNFYITWLLGRFVPLFQYIILAFITVALKVGHFGIFSKELSL